MGYLLATLQLEINNQHVQKAMTLLIQPLEDEGRYQKVCIEMYRTLFTHHCDFDILSE